jgi:hypothetical protein
LTSGRPNGGAEISKVQAESTLMPSAKDTVAVPK